MSALTPTDYLEELFGTRKTSLHPYLTKNLLEISKLTLESRAELLLNQTLAPIFMHFLPKYRQQIRNGLFSSKSNQAIRACQFSSFKQKEVLTIKYCPKCSNGEVRNQGFSYWHVSHQLPGIDVCYLHGLILHKIPIIDRQIFDSLYLPPINQPENWADELSIGLSKHANEMKNRICAGTEVTNAKEYIHRLKALGFVTANGNIRISKLSNTFYTFSLHFKNVSSSLLPRSAQDHRYLSSLLLTRYSQHPFKHILFSYWLSEQRKNDDAQVETASKRIIIQDNITIEQQCLQMLKNNSSMGEVSRATGKSYSYIKTLAIRNGVKLNLMPKKLTPLTISKIVTLAEKGFHREVIANKFEVSTGSIEQVISSVAGLVERRKRGKFESKARRSKAQVLRFLNRSPNALIKDVKSECNAAYYWLYSNDRDWLSRNMPSASERKRSSRVDWSQRDIELSAKIVEILSSLDFLPSRTKLDQILGCHGWLTKYKHRLPLSLNTYVRYKEVISAGVKNATR